MTEKRRAELERNILESTGSSYQNDFNADTKPQTIDTQQFPLYSGVGGGSGDTAVIGTGRFNGSVAISFWNCSDQRLQTKTFRQHHPLTKNHMECFDEQFR